MEEEICAIKLLEKTILKIILLSFKKIYSCSVVYSSSNLNVPNSLYTDVAFFFLSKNRHACEQRKHARASARYENEGGVQERKEKNVCGQLWEKKRFI